MKENIVNIETVHQCNCCLGYKTLHPLVSVIDLSQADLEQCTLHVDFYTIFLIEGKFDDFLYGRKYYDYSNASLIFLTPGEYLKINPDELPGRKGWLLAFHPDLLYHTSLGDHIGNYSFFFYRTDEALHLSLRERARVTECLCNIGEELRHAVDGHSRILLSRHIELLLDYCSRFYERQFITRSEAHKTIVAQTNVWLDEYIRSGKLKKGVFPSVEYCAGVLRLSSHYLSDLLKFETGKNMHEYFQFKRLEASRRMLLEPGNTVEMVAEKLGYPNVQYFSCIFKKMTGIAPNDYRSSQN